MNDVLLVTVVSIGYNLVIVPKLWHQNAHHSKNYDYKSKDNTWCFGLIFIKWHLWISIQKVVCNQL